MRYALAGGRFGVAVAVLPGGTVNVAVRVDVAVRVLVPVAVTVVVGVTVGVLVIVGVCDGVRVSVTVGVSVMVGVACTQALDGPLIRIWPASFLMNGELGGAKRPQKPTSLATIWTSRKSIGPLMAST